MVSNTISKPKGLTEWVESNRCMGVLIVVSYVCRLFCRKTESRGPNPVCPAGICFFISQQKPLSITRLKSLWRVLCSNSWKLSRCFPRILPCDSSVSEFNTWYHCPKRVTSSTPTHAQCRAAEQHALNLRRRTLLKGSLLGDMNI